MLRVHIVILDYLLELQILADFLVLLRITLVNCRTVETSIGFKRLFSELLSRIKARFLTKFVLRYILLILIMQSPSLVSTLFPSLISTFIPRCLLNRTASRGFLVMFLYLFLLLTLRQLNILFLENLIQEDHCSIR